jgi:rhamnose utilization protein RhaD (predicted bifunctional aldolase and dehydrogenase)/NAD(P)-dependent dehydrogenase (short-subunit alcohol dehydrogenase family)
MKSRWSDEDAAAQADDLDLLAYTSRLLGADTSLVLAGGGNSSVKSTEADVFGDPVDVLHVKGSGWDMATIERAGFAPLRLDRVARLAELPELSDSRMANELKAASLDAAGPAPSVESILHAILPFRFVLHTHADAVLALTNTLDGPSLVREVYGNEVVVVPYVMPGFVLAGVCAERFAAGRHEGTVGMVLLNHGLFTFAHDARLAYENHIDLVGRALARVESPGVTASALPAPTASVDGPAASPAPPPTPPAAGPSAQPAPPAATVPGTGPVGAPPAASAEGPPAPPVPPPSATVVRGWPAPPAPLDEEPGEPGADDQPAGGPGAAEPPPPPAVPTVSETAAEDGAPDPGADDGEPAEDLDAGAFGAGDPTAFGSGAGTPGGEILPAGDDAGEAGALGATAGRGADVVLEGEAGALAMLRRDISAAAGQPMILCRAAGDEAARFVARDDLAAVSQVGPATPDHVLRTKRVPLVGRDVAGYVRDYRAYVERHRARLGDRPVVPVDPAPRMVVDPELGVLGAGRRPADAATAVEIYDHTMWIIDRAVALGGYAVPSEADIFDVEYWELEQAKLARQPAPAPLAGRVALVTGAASGIGRATTLALLDAGAAVVGLDLDAAVEQVADGPAFVGAQGDAGEPAAVDRALALAARSFGGLDLLVLNAGVFPSPEPVAEVAPESWERAMAVNAGAALVALQAAHPFLRASPAGGGVVVVASKNVPAPGRGAAAYSASKAALTQLARVTALEWGSDRIRVNVVHPDAVFDTGLWDDALIAERAAAYGLTPEEYRTRNVLGAEVGSEHVAAAVVALCGPTFARTTGAQIAVDGGNDRVI